MPVMIVSFQGWSGDHAVCSSALAGIRTSPPAPLLPGHAGHGLVGFQLCGHQRRVRAVPCLHRSRASAGGMQGKMNRCGHPVPPSRLP